MRRGRWVVLIGLLFVLVPARAVDITGTWKATLPGGSPAGGLTLQLHQRADGDVIGYIPGGTASRTLVGGSVSGRNIRLEMEFKDPRVTERFTISGRAHGEIITGMADDGSGLRRIVLHRTAEVLHERRFVFAIPSAGSAPPAGLVHLSVVFDSRGRFVGGGFISQEDCRLFACGGSVTSFRETGATISVRLETGGACSGRGSFTASFDSGTKFFSGSYAFTDCTGAKSGDLIGVKSTRTRTDHVAGILASLGRVADDLEARTAFTAPYAPVSPLYFHYGNTLSHLLADLGAEVATYGSIRVVFNRFRNIKTVEDTDTHPAFDTPIGADFQDQRMGVPPAGGSTVTYRDTDTGSGLRGDTALRFFAQERGAWVIAGAGRACDTRFTTFPVALSDVRAIVPLGLVSPFPGRHVFPVAYTYLSLRVDPSTGGQVITNFVAPGGITITAIERFEQITELPGTILYGIGFHPTGCSTQTFHVNQLLSLDSANVSAPMIAQAGDWQWDEALWDARICSNDGFLKSCRKDVSITLLEGASVGTIGGGTGLGGTSTHAINFAAYDASLGQTFIRPERYGSIGSNSPYHGFCPLNHYSDTINTALSGRFGTMDLSLRRTASPECGAVSYDVPGSAQGNWFRSDLPASFANADGHLALVFDHIDPSIPVISAGRTRNDTIPSFTAYTFTPNLAAGYVRQPFDRVRQDGHRYCYDGLTVFSGSVGGPATGRILVEVTGPEGLRIEKQPGDCTGDPALWSFGLDATDYLR